MASQAEAVVEKLEERLASNPGSHVFPRVADSYRKQGDIKRAIDICTRGIALQPESVTGRLILGRCHLEQENFDAAVEEFTQICRLDHRNHMAIKMLADIFSKQGFEEKAGDLYALLLTMDPDNPSLIHLSKIFKGTGKADLMEILGEQVVSKQASTGNEISENAFEQSPSESTDEVSDSTDELFDPAEKQSSGTQQSDMDTIDSITGDDIDSRMDQMFSDDVSGGAAGEMDLADITGPFSTENDENDQPHEVASDDSEDHDIDFAVNSELKELDSLLDSADSDDSMISGKDVSGRLDEMFSDEQPASEALSESRESGNISDDLPEEGEDHAEFDLNLPEFSSEELEDSLETDESEDDESISGDDIAEKIDSFFESTSETADEAATESASAMPPSDTEEIEDHLSGDDISSRIDELFESSAADDDMPVIEPADDNDHLQDFTDTKQPTTSDKLDFFPADTEENESTVREESAQEDLRTEESDDGNEVIHHSGGNKKTPDDTIELHGSDADEVQHDLEPFTSFSEPETSYDLDYLSSDASDIKDVEDSIAHGETLSLDRKTLDSLQNSGDTEQFTGDDVETRLNEMFGDDEDESISEIKTGADAANPEAKPAIGSISSQQKSDDFQERTDEIDLDTVDVGPEERVEKSDSDQVAHSETTRITLTKQQPEEQVDQTPEMFEDTVADDYLENDNEPFSGDDISDRLDSIFGPEEDIVSELEAFSKNQQLNEDITEQEQARESAPEVTASSNKTPSPEIDIQDVYGGQREKNPVEEIQVEEQDAETGVEDFEDDVLDLSDEILSIQNETSKADSDGRNESSQLQQMQPDDTDVSSPDEKSEDETMQTEPASIVDEKETKEEEFDLEMLSDDSDGEDRGADSIKPEEQNASVIEDTGISDVDSAELVDLVDDTEIDLGSLPEEADDEDGESVSEFYSVGGGDARDLSEEDQELLATIEDASAESKDVSSESADIDLNDIADSVGEEEEEQFTKSLESDFETVEEQGREEDLDSEGEDVIENSIEEDALDEADVKEDVTGQNIEFDFEAVPSGAVSCSEKEDSGLGISESIQHLAIPDHVLTPTLADIYFQQGQPHLAIQIYRRLLEKDPDDERIEARIGQIQKAIDEAEMREKEETRTRTVHQSQSGNKRKPRSSTTKKSRARSSRTKQSRAQTDEEKPLKGVKIKKRIKAKIRKNRKTG